MGLFSYKCSCRRSIAGPAAERVPEWMRWAIVHYPDGEVFMGRYDGSGRLQDPNDMTGVPVQDMEVGHQLRQTADLACAGDLRHVVCWFAAGQPGPKRKRSSHASDQGWFMGQPKKGAPADFYEARQAAESRLTAMTDKDWQALEKAAEQPPSDFVGKTIARIRPMTPQELQAECWEHDRYQQATVIELNDGTLLYPSRDTEGNGPGALFGLVGGKQVLIMREEVG